MHRGSSLGQRQDRRTWTKMDTMEVSWGDRDPDFLGIVTKLFQSLERVAVDLLGTKGEYGPVYYEGGATICCHQPNLISSFGISLRTFILISFQMCRPSPFPCEKFIIDVKFDTADSCKISIIWMAYFFWTQIFLHFRHNHKTQKQMKYFIKYLKVEWSLMESYFISIIIFITLPQEYR